MCMSAIIALFQAGRIDRRRVLVFVRLVGGMAWIEAMSILHSRALGGLLFEPV